MPAGAPVSTRPTQPPDLGEYADERNLERFWREAPPRREPLRQRWFVPAVLVLVALSVPWYLPQRLVSSMVGGLPIWTWITVACSAGIAAITAWVALRHWDDDDR